MNRVFGKDSTTNEVLEGIDLTDKVALVTGGTSGLGVETARALASKGAQVIITGRNMPKAHKVAEEIKAETGQEVATEELELDSFESIRAFSERVTKQYPNLNILVNNAGVMAAPHQTTQDGVEWQFGTNHLGHFLMTNLVMPSLLNGTPARIVNLSSARHQSAPVDFDDVNFEQRDYDRWIAYGQSKTANVLFTVGLEKRLADQGVHAYAVHPGVIMTELARHMAQEEIDVLAKQLSNANMTKTAQGGSATSVYAATAPELANKGGIYLSDCQEAEVNDEEQSQIVVRSYALSPDGAEKLWSLSEQMVGQQFKY